MNLVATHPKTPVSIACIGAGRVAQALHMALQRLDSPLVALGRRSVPSGGAELICSPQEAADRAELVLLTVPDDAIAAVAAGLRWRPGQAVVHCSGATEVAALDAAARMGALTGGFHPLQIFSNPARAADLLAGSSVAIEAAEPLQTQLRQLAERLGMRPITLPPGARARYHAAAGYAASFLLPVLDEAVQLWRSFGVDEAAALQALLPLARGTLDAVDQRGLAGALSGPISRGDTGVIERHLAELARLGAPHEQFYRQLAQRLLGLARDSGRLNAEQLRQLADLLDAEPAPTDRPL
jgi:predicted short-subunit dehydrogenase-like oxidoreductase (DUF2520 family)